MDWISSLLSGKIKKTRLLDFFPFVFLVYLFNTTGNKLDLVFGLLAFLNAILLMAYWDVYNKKLVYSQKPRKGWRKKPRQRRKVKVSFMGWMYSQQAHTNTLINISILLQFGFYFYTLARLFINQEYIWVVIGVGIFLYIWFYAIFTYIILNKDIKSKGLQ